MNKRKIDIGLDYVTNILTIIVAVIFIGLFIRNYAYPYFFNQSTVKSPTIGKIVEIEGFDSTKNSKNVLIVMMKGCRFCEESMGFYRHLIQQYQVNGKANIIAIFPLGMQDAKGYLKSQEIVGIEIKTAELSKIEVDGTPTIIVTDNNGKILKSWGGKLSSEKENEIINFLNS